MESGAPERNQTASRQLTSWKEIADYLGVNVRTAQKWEKRRALPVRRLPGGRGAVSISTAAVDDWRRQAVPVRRRGLLLATIGTMCTAIASAVQLLGRGGRRPATVRTAGSSLVALDEGGQELWQYPFGYPLANDEVQQQPGLQNCQFSWTGDVDGDGLTEVLFIPQPRVGKVPADWGLYCLSDEGALKWRYLPGEYSTRFAREYRAPYCPLNLLVFDDGPAKRIAVASVHHTWFPGQIAVLTHTGRVAMEYWHSGHLIQLGVADSGPGGSAVLLAGGVSNAYKVATMVALRAGANGSTVVSAEENEKYQLPGEKATEVARILFPRSRISERMGPYNVVTTIRTVANETQVSVREDLASGAEVIHRFGAGIQYLGAGLSSNYEGRHRELQKMGLIESALRAEEDSRRLREIRWIREPNWR
jgi:hypothetical protein